MHREHAKARGTAATVRRTLLCNGCITVAANTRLVVPRMSLSGSEGRGAKGEIDFAATQLHGANAIYKIHGPARRLSQRRRSPASSKGSARTEF